MQEATQKAVWQTPELQQLDVFETARGNGGSDGMGAGSGSGGNSSGS